MRLEVVHTTRFRYSSKIAETVMEMRVRPLDGLGQRVDSFDLNVDPRANISAYRDGFGNHVHYFNHLAPHDQITVVSHSVVETEADPAPGLDASFADDFLQFRRPVLDVPGIRRIATRLAPEDAAAADAVEVALDQLARDINHRFEYQSESTDVYTAVDEVLKLRKGVCQDFAHLFVSVGRAMGVPTRYVSGYIPAGGGRVGFGASHAWAEAMIPGRGWVGYDPTNPVRAGEDHVRVAVGRDYHDVPPTRGVYIGGATEEMEVVVETRRL